MTFNYFNTSYLAFGSKLKKAFKSLGGLLDNGYKKLDSLTYQLNFINSYIGKNYQVDNPNKGTDPCNCNTIYKVLGNNPIVGLDIEKNESNDGIKVDLIYFDRINNKLCTASNSSKNLPNGIAYLIPSSINNNFNGEIRFVNQDTSNVPATNAIKLFDYDLVKDENLIVLSNLSQYIELVPGLYDRPYNSGRIVDVTNTYCDIELPSRKMLLVKTVNITDNISIRVKFKGDSNSTLVYQVSPNTGGKWSNYLFPLYLNKGDILYKNDQINRVYEVIYE